MEDKGSLPLRERGLKYNSTGNPLHDLKVAPLAGAWIEIKAAPAYGQARESLPLRERGLKSHPLLFDFVPLYVAPLAGAWIEIVMYHALRGFHRVAPLAGAWIEIL